LHSGFEEADQFGKNKPEFRTVQVQIVSPGVSFTYQESLLQLAVAADFFDKMFLRCPFAQMLERLSAYYSDLKRDLSENVADRLFATADHLFDSGDSI
jgi:hypothetical protein